MAFSKAELEEIVEELENYKGRHTELITVYISAGYDVNSVQKQLEAEKSTAKNIKSATTRKNVIDALEKIIREFKSMKKTPENGLAVFCGNISSVEGQQEIELWAIEPPMPLKTRLYRCDKEFVLEPLKEMLEVEEVYGLLVMDRKEATLGLLEGKRIEILQKMTSGIPSKVRAGGQCHPHGTLIQLNDGDIVRIEKTHNPLITKSIKNINSENFSLDASPITAKWETDKKEVYKIKTIFPQLVVESSGDHLFLVFRGDKIIETAAEELKCGDVLIMPEKIDVVGVKHKFNSGIYHNSFIINESGRKFLRDRRNQLNISQKKLAETMNSVQTVVSYYEIGRQNAMRDFLFKLCVGIGIDFADFVDKYTSPSHYKDTCVRLPSELDEKFAQFLGYYLGDGCIENDRITFFEQRKEVALRYKKIYDSYFNIKSSYKFRENKNYHQLRFTSRPLVKLIRSEFPEIKKTLDSEVPKKILTSEDKVVSGFLRGVFDAEGYVVKDSIGIGSNNKTLIEQILFLLLRFSIISSFQEYDNKKNPYSDNPIFKLQINEKKSLENFREFIGFTSNEKENKLDVLIDSKSNKSSVRQVLISGRKVAGIIKERGYNLRDFPKVSNFFRNQRLMGKETFKNSILNLVENDRELFDLLKKIYECPLLPVKISEINRRMEKIKMTDIETKNHNFIANGLIVHNSSQRFHRITEGLTKDFYKRIAEEMKKCFFEMPKLKGILVGGPIPTKDEFLDGDYLVTKLREKIIGRIDLGGSDESGLKELVTKSQDILANQEIIHEKKVLENFFRTLGENPNMATLKEPDTKQALKYGAVNTLFLSDDLNKSLAKELKKTAENINAKIEIISDETEEGQQFKNLGGIGAILRFKI